MQKSSGFSLIELMVVVSIIGVVATIAIPRYMHFRARARQVAAKSEASAIYTAEKSFLAQYETYHAYLPAIGFEPSLVEPMTMDGAVTIEAKRAYASTADYIIDPDNASNTPVPLADLGLPLPPRYSNLWKAWGASINLCFSQYAPFVVGMQWFAYNMAEPVKCPKMSSTQFCALIIGCPSGNLGIVGGSPFPAGTDAWMIREDRSLTNVQSGIN